MSQKLAVDGFKWRYNKFKFYKKIIQDYDEGSDEGCILEVDAEYPEKLHELHNDLVFFSEIMNFEKYEKLKCNLCNKKLKCPAYGSHKAGTKSWIKTKKMYRE